jgi:hypothetical protein
MRESRSAIAYLIRVGQLVLDQVLAGATCPICKLAAGEHTPACLVGQAILNDPTVAARAKAARERDR